MTVTAIYDPEQWQLVPKVATQEMIYAMFGSGSILGKESEARLELGYQSLLEAAPRHESQWQDISTAPRDEQILLYGHYWSDQQGMMQKPLIGMWNANACRWEAAWMCWFGVRPTHWMPLPMPPTLDPLPVDVDGEPYFPRDKKCKCGAYVRKGYACTCCWRVWK